MQTLQEKPIRETEAYKTGYEKYRRDSTVRACVDTLTRRFRDYLIVSAGVADIPVAWDLNPEDLAGRQSSMLAWVLFFGMEPRQIGFMETTTSQT